MELSSITTVGELEEVLSAPFPEDIEAARRLTGDVLVLGAGGKMGPTLVRRLLRAIGSAPVSVYAASRFSDAGSRRRLESWGARTIRADLLDPQQLRALPECPLVVYLVGSKFGTVGNEPRTWTLNAYLPGRVAERFQRSRIVAFSTGNVYPLVAVESGGSRETDETAPVGEYAQSCLGRERILQYFSGKHSTPMAILRLNYAVEARYGVLLDVAVRVRDGLPVPLKMGYVNAIWQGDANSIAIRALAHCRTPPLILNVAGAETLSVRRLAEEFGERLGLPVNFEGGEARNALLSNSSRCRQLFGNPHVSLEEMIDLVANWVGLGGPILEKPTRFEVRTGEF